MPTVWKKVQLKETEEEIMALPREAVTCNLTERETKFCEYFVGNHNNKIACMKAGFKGSSAHIQGWKLRQKYDVNLYIAWLKLRVSKDCHLSAMDLIDQYMRIAFADITDFVTIKKGRATVTDSDMIDGQIVKSIKQTPNGAHVEFYDKISAMEKLERFLDFVPADWRQRLEERKVELMEQKLELERIKMGYLETEDVDDGFLDALKETAEQVWNDELEEQLPDVGEE